MNSHQHSASSSLNELVAGSAEHAKILAYPSDCTGSSSNNNNKNSDDSFRGEGGGRRRDSNREYSRRLEELERLGVTAIFSGGRTVIGGIHVAGKGCVGIVVKAKAHGRLCALKIRRTDANRPSMQEEVRYHKIANASGVGPQLVDYSDNFILMEFVKGSTIVDWAQNKITRAIGSDVVTSVSDNDDSLCCCYLAKNAASIAIRSSLEQCYALDRAGLDHGELSHVDRHIIVDDACNATIIDFESASTKRKMSNVSAAGQSLLVSGAVAGSLSKILYSSSPAHIKDKREAIIGALKRYKIDQTRNNFDAILALF
jgi:putative serine/threonine protein kinase